MSTKSPKTRTRKRQPKDDVAIETVAPVHKPLKKQKSIENKATTEDNSESNKTYSLEDNNENTIQQINRDVSMETDIQINSKIENGIIGFMETEIKKEKSKYTHFTDSRPQSLSFYEEERIPEELSGQLEPLSPEEKKVYKRRKEERKIDIELDASMYKEIQNVLNREKEEVLLAGIMKSQKSKSRKKKQYDSEENIVGMGDSREQIISSGKKRTKKSKKRENSPNATHSKKKHRRRDDNEPKNDITVALEELQDDVFEKDPNEIKHYDGQPQNPGRANTVYVQKRNGFEPTPRDRLFSVVDINKEDVYKKSFLEMSPVELATKIQKCWMPFTLLCHGVLSGLALAHIIVTQCSSIDNDFVRQYSIYSEAYTSCFFFLCVICLVSVCDRYDIKHLSVYQFSEIIQNRKSMIVVLVYFVALLVHLINETEDDRISLYNYLENGNQTTIYLMTTSELQKWNMLSFWRSLLVIIGWIIVALSSQQDLLYAHINSLKQYLDSPRPSS